MGWGGVGFPNFTSIFGAHDIQHDCAKNRCKILGESLYYYILYPILYFVYFPIFDFFLREPGDIFS